MIPALAMVAAAVLAPQSAMRAAGSDSMAQMKWHRRVLLIAAPHQEDLNLKRQRIVLSKWRGGGQRDVSVVQVIGGRVTGATDGAAALRKAHRLDPKRFTAILIGKDGHEALRSSEPLTGVRLEQVIDAMPMRQDER